MSFMGRIDRDSMRVGEDPESREIPNRAAPDSQPTVDWIRNEAPADPSKPIDHAASARENLRQAGRDLLATVVPQAILQVSYLHRTQRADGQLAQAAMKDLSELVIGPLAAVKDAADAAIHGLIAAFRKVR